MDRETIISTIFEFLSTGERKEIMTNDGETVILEKNEHNNEFGITDIEFANDEAADSFNEYFYYACYRLCIDPDTSYDLSDELMMIKRDIPIVPTLQEKKQFMDYDNCREFSENAISFIMHADTKINDVRNYTLYEDKNGDRLFYLHNNNIRSRRPFEFIIIIACNNTHIRL